MQARPPRSTWCLMLLAAVSTAVTARGADPERRVLELAPPDATCTLVVTDLRGHAARWASSPLEARVRPFLDQTRDAEPRRGLRETVTNLERALEVSATQIRDEIFGSDVAFCLRIAPGAPPEQARGLLLTRVRDRALLGRLLARINAAGPAEGGPNRVVARQYLGQTYQRREFDDPARPAESYIVLDDVLAWSNDASLIEGVIEREALVDMPAGLARDPKVAKISRALGSSPFLTVLVDPRGLERLLPGAPGGPPPKPDAKPDEVRVARLLFRYLQAVEYAGATFAWGAGGFEARLAEVVAPERLDTVWRPRKRAQGPSTPPLIPVAALAVAWGRVDFGRAYDLLLAAVPEEARPRFDLLLDLARGFLLDLDPRRDVLPRLGPEVLAVIESPPADSERPLGAIAVALGFQERPPEAAGARIEAALRNALRTLLVARALNVKSGPHALATSTIDGLATTSLEPTRGLAFAVTGDRALLATSPAAVGRLHAVPPSDAKRLGDRLDAALTRDLEAIARVDLERLADVVERYRGRLAGRLAERRGMRPDDAARDIDDFRAALTLFRDVEFWAAGNDDASTARFGLNLNLRGK